VVLSYNTGNHSPVTIGNEDLLGGVRLARVTMVQFNEAKREEDS
jgi:hypothetical protein